MQQENRTVSFPFALDVFLRDLVARLGVGGDQVFTLSGFVLRVSSGWGAGCLFSPCLNMLLATPVVPYIGDGQKIRS